jgi:predicted transcriptional regulator
MKTAVKQGHGMESTNKMILLESTAAVISAYVANNTIQKEHLPALIVNTFNALARLDRTEAPAEELKPAVPIKRSVQPDHIICLEDGKKFKTLKRHLRTDYNMTPQEYREKWGLPVDYPMVAPNYALARSELAKQIGLGRPKTAETPKTSVKPSKKTTEKTPVGKKRAVAAAS